MMTPQPQVKPAYPGEGGPNAPYLAMASEWMQVNDGDGKLWLDDLASTVTKEQYKRNGWPKPVKCLGKNEFVPEVA